VLHSCAIDTTHWIPNWHHGVREQPYGNAGNLAKSTTGHTKTLARYGLGLRVCSHRCPLLSLTSLARQEEALLICRTTMGKEFWSHRLRARGVGSSY
jgi:hypothetical protein